MIVRLSRCDHMATKMCSLSSKWCRTASKLSNVTVLLIHIYRLQIVRCDTVIIIVRHIGGYIKSAIQFFTWLHSSRGTCFLHKYSTRRDSVIVLSCTSYLKWLIPLTSWAVSVSLLPWEIYCTGRDEIQSAVTDAFVIIIFFMIFETRSRRENEWMQKIV